MQCNYLFGNSDHPTTYIHCSAGPGDYIPTDKDRSDYCMGLGFTDCPRYITHIKMKE